MKINNLELCEIGYIEARYFIILQSYTQDESDSTVTQCQFPGKSRDGT